MKGDDGCKVLNIVGIDPRVNEGFLTEIFNNAGQVTNLRITPDHSFQYGGLSSGIVEFATHADADTAMNTLNGRKIFDNAISLTWALSVGATRVAKEDTTNHYHLWVGDLSTEVDEQALVNAFSSYKSLSDAKVMWDMNTGKPRGYGFVSFKEKSDAELAQQQMNGALVGKKHIRINWAHQKSGGATPMLAAGAPSQSGGKVGAYSSAPIYIQPTKPSLNYHTVVNQASPMHTTVYVGGVPSNCTTDMLQPVFQAYGYVVDIKVNAERGFAFIKYDNHESAATAISYIHGLVLNGAKLKCSWGKDKNAEAAYAQQQHKYGVANTGFGTQPAYSYPYGAGSASDPQQMASAYNMDPAQYQAYYNYYMQYYQYMQAQAAQLQGGDQQQQQLQQQQQIYQAQVQSQDQGK